MSVPQSLLRGIERWNDPAEHDEFVQASIAPQRHRKAPQAAQHGARAPCLNRSSEASKGVEWLPVAAVVGRPQSLLRGIERWFLIASLTRP